MATKTKQAMRDEIKQTAAKRFRAMLLLRRLSYRDAAKSAGVSLTTVNNLANAKTHVSLLSVVRLAKALGCRVSELAP